MNRGMRKGFSLFLGVWKERKQTLGWRESFLSGGKQFFGQRAGILVQKLFYGVIVYVFKRVTDLLPFDTSAHDFSP